MVIELKNGESARRLATLQYDSLDELKSSSAIPKNAVDGLKRLSCTKSFERVESLYDGASKMQKEGDEERAYIFYTRLSYVAEMIIKKNDFSAFKETPDGRRFYDLFKTSLGNLEEMEESLKKRYELKELGRSYAAIELSRSEEKTKEVEKSETSKKEEKLFITPRELVHYVEAGHSVLVIDYRIDQSRQIEHPGAFFNVVSVPHDAINSGCICRTLIQCVAVGERAKLNRMSEYDLIVMMGSDVDAEHNTLHSPGTKEHILYNALTTYNLSSRLRRSPVVLNGGFPSWERHYPMYTSGASLRHEKTIDFDDRSEFAKLVAKFRKDHSVATLRYPDLFARSKPVDTAPQQLVSRPVQDSPIPSRESSFSSLPQPSPSSSLYSSLSSAISGPSSEISVDSTPCAVVSSSTSIPKKPESQHLDLGVRADKVTRPSSAAVRPEFTGIEANKPAAALRPPPPPVDRRSKPKSDGGASISNENVPNKEKGKLSTYPSLAGTTPPPRAAALGGARVEFQNDSTLLVRPSIPDRSIKPRQSRRDEFVSDLLGLYTQMMKMIDETSERKNVECGCTGLYNLGNTCFMNSTLQALFHTQLLREIFTYHRFSQYVNQSNDLGTMGAISAAFSALMDAVWSGQYSVIRPSEFLNTFADQVNRSLADRRQHDAQEFQIYLLDALHEDMNRITKRVPFEQNYTGHDICRDAEDYSRRSKQFASSPVNDVFGCRTVSLLKCEVCGFQSVTFEEITQLSIELTKDNTINLEECIARHFRPVVLDGSCKWNCPKCCVPRTATRSTFIWNLPRVLVVHLKRFSLSEFGWEKNDIFVQYGFVFSLSRYIHPLSPYSDSNARFNLYAVTNHSGRLNSGHYTSIAYNYKAKKWLSFDDELVNVVDSNHICNRNAFILYFSQEKLTQ
ncbi:hypothetical protein AB6A40_003639 [Gnathostoma spinigerum]|uniref:Ubiquitin carboxyl-terminal hydrolase n=1 Tax=Gnathostoma spinigerum TaxID=75299 RepID=A0ABD6EBB5_9BILA